MLDLNSFRIFVEVADRGGLSAAARALRKPVSTVSYRIQELERELGLTLLARTSRQVALTDCGKVFYSHAISTLARADEAELAMRSRLEEPSGTVSYTVAVAAAEYAMPDMVASFLDLYPKIELIQHVSNSRVDLVCECVDFEIRSHVEALPNSALVQRSLAAAPWHIYASPSYLKLNGTPDSPEELTRHHTLFMTQTPESPTWRISSQNESLRTIQLSLRPRISSACVVTLKRTAIAGKGIVALPAYVCRDEVRTGLLERVLTGWTAGQSTITALMVSRRGMTAGARAFLDHIADAFPEAVRLG